MQIVLPNKVKKIINILETAGFEAFAVGGCVRDAYLGRIPNDWDITTSALPEQVKTLFSKTIDTGIQHGTVTVLIGGEGFEVTTYRIDGIYEDARHPKQVSFTSNIVEDLKRRDFTINAMAYSETRGLVDEFDGIGDLRRGIIRCVGNPIERFSEDALRMMRAVRFAAQLGFDIHDDTRDAIKELAPNLYRVSAERIMTELTKLITSDHPDMLRDVYELGLTDVFFPEFNICMESEQNNKWHIYSVGEHILHTMQAVQNNRILRFTMMLHDIAKPECKTVDPDGTTHNKGHAEKGAEKARNILRRLKSDNELVDTVTILIRYHDWRFEPDKRSVRRAINKVGPNRFAMLLNVQEADMMGQSDYKKEEKIERLKKIREEYRQILADKEAVSIKDLDIKGKDLICLGIKEGPEIGRILNLMLEHVLDVPEDNKREILLKLLEEYK